MSDHVIIPLPRFLEPSVRLLYQECHPGWPELPPRHFFAFPTVVAVSRERLLGYASYSINFDPDGSRSILLQDSGVEPAVRGTGLARTLLRHRVAIGREMDARCAIGMTQPDNAAMFKILRTEGFDEVKTLPNAYADGRDGVLFILKLGAR